MREVTLRMNEQERYELIKNLIEKKGNKRVVSIKLNCSLRTIDRLINKFKIKGKKGFVHDNRDLKPSNAIKENIKETIIATYKKITITHLTLTIFVNYYLKIKILKFHISLFIIYFLKQGFIHPNVNALPKKE